MNWSQRTWAIGAAVAISVAVSALPSAAATRSESFEQNPLARGWQVAGDANLFEWQASSGTLAVTWDSSKPNSFFALPLGRTLHKADDFSFAFDLRLTEVAAGVAPAKPNPFQLAAGLIRLSRANSVDFMRGTGSDSPDLVEFNFFPDPGGAWQWGPSLTAAMIDSTGTNWSSGGFAPAELEPNVSYRVTVTYSASEQSLTTSITADGAPYSTLSVAKLGESFTDFSVDHFAISSYSEAGQFPAYAGSVFAKGAIDNVVVTTASTSTGPSLTAPTLVNDRWHVQISATRAGATYLLERSQNLATWEPAGSGVTVEGPTTVIADTNQPVARAFYRVREVQ